MAFTAKLNHYLVIVFTIFHGTKIKFKFQPSVFLKIGFNDFSLRIYEVVPRLLFCNFTATCDCSLLIVTQSPAVANTSS